MRIAVFTDSYRPRISGLVSSIDEFSRGFEERGHEVLIVCPSYPEALMRDAVDPPRVLRIPAGPAVVSSEDRLALPWRERKGLKKIGEFRPDIVHVQTEFSIGGLGRRYCREHGLPVVTTSHTHYEMYIGNYIPILPRCAGRRIVKAWMAALLRKDEFVIVPSRQIETVLRSYGIEREFEIIPTGVDERVFHPRPEEARELRARLSTRWPNLASGPVLAYIGRIGHEKNVKLLIEAFALILKEAPEACLLMVGDGPALSEVKKLAHELKVSHRLFMTGYVERALLPAFYSMADILLFPSSTETQGLVTIESMLCGTPVVGVNEMGTAEVMEGEAGGLLAKKDKADFADKVISLLKDQELLDTKSREALSRGRDWTMAVSCDRLEKVYRRAIAMGRLPRRES